MDQPHPLPLPANALVAGSSHPAFCRKILVVPTLLPAIPTHEAAALDALENDISDVVAADVPDSCL